MILKSYILYRASSSVGPISSTVVTDDVTISGDGSASNPIQIKSGYLGSAALQDLNAFDSAGSAAAALSSANSYTDGLINTRAPLMGSKVIQAEIPFLDDIIIAGTSIYSFRMPFAMTLSDIRMSLGTAQTSGNIITVDVNESGSSILSTKLTVDNGEKTSTTATTPPVISDTALADDSEITFDIDQVGDGTGRRIIVTFIGS